AATKREFACSRRAGLPNGNAGKHAGAAAPVKRDKADARRESRENREKSKGDSGAKRDADSSRENEQSGSRVIDTAVAKVHGIKSGPKFQCTRSPTRRSRRAGFEIGRASCRERVEIAD